jgi:hypothetical protein
MGACFRSPKPPVFFTIDKGLQYRQNLASRSIAIPIVRAKSNRLADVLQILKRAGRSCVRSGLAKWFGLGFDLYLETEIEGELPGGGRDRARMTVSSVVAFLVMKGMALDDRLKEKDAWDVYFTLTNYPGGVDALAEEIRPHMKHRLVEEGIRKMAGKFASPEHTGPKFVADFDDIQDREERAIRMRDAYERVHQLLKILGFHQ